MANSWISNDVFFEDAISMANSWVSADVLFERAIFRISD